MGTWLRILRLMRPYKLRVAIAVACMFGYAFSNGAMAWLIGPVMKFLFSGGEGAGIDLVPFGLFTISKDKMLMAVPLAIVAVAALKGLSSYGQSFFMGSAGQYVVRDIRGRLYEKILDQPVHYFSTTPTGVLVSRLTNDVNLLQTAAAEAVTTILKQSFTIIVLAGVIISLDWKLAVAAFVVLPLLVYPMRRLGKKMKKASTHTQVTMGTMMSLLHEAIAGVRIVKAFCMERYESERFAKENHRFSRYQVKTIKVRSISSPLMETLGSVGFAITIWYAAYRISHGTLKPEDFVSFFAAVIMFYQPLKALNGVNLSLQQGLAAASRVFEVLDRPGETAEDGQTEIDGLKDSIEFRGVGFSYGKDRVLEDINLRVEKGEVLAIVGGSGAGKTTFVNLIPRYYDVSSGSILIDGKDIRGITRMSLRSQIAIVSQQVVLFNDTVKNNIAYGHIERSDEEVEAAAKAANAHDFISRLPQGYDTVIGESGVRLSGGERQRLSIARAILKNAPILILDEATSSLDAESEHEVQKALANLMEGRTTFVIAHRLTTVRNAGRIIVLAGGSISEIGRHEDLMGSDGEYSRLYSLQFNS